MERISKQCLPGGVEVTIRAKREWIELSGYCLTYLLSVGVCFGAIYELWQDGNPAIVTILALVIVYRTVVCLMRVGWCLFGKEVLRVWRGTLTWERKVGSLGSSRSYLVSAIHGLRLDISKVPWLKASRLSKWSPIFGQIAFEYHGRIQGVALKVDSEQAQEVLAALSAQLQGVPAVNAPLSVATTAVPPPPVPQSAPVAVAPPAAVGEAPAFCRNCGTRQRPGRDLFCDACGFNLKSMPAPTAAPMPAPPPLAVEIPGEMRERLGAVIADGCLVLMATAAAWFGLGISAYLPSLGVSAFLPAWGIELIEGLEIGVLYGIILLGYMVVAQTIWQTTIGKYIFELELASSTDLKAKPGFGVILLRETIGKFCSAIVFGYGFLRALWNPRKQTWHDQLADTIVRKRATLPALRKQLTALVAVCLIVCVGSAGYSRWKTYQQNRRETAARDFSISEKECLDAWARVEAVPGPADGQWATRQERDRTMLSRVNEFGDRLDDANQSIHLILRNELYRDNDEYERYVFNEKIYKLRTEQNQKRKEALQLVLATSPDSRDLQDKDSEVNMMNREVDSYNNEVQELVIQWQETHAPDNPWGL